jgi:hypothetical protein
MAAAFLWGYAPRPIAQSPNAGFKSTGATGAE